MIVPTLVLALRRWRQEGHFKAILGCGQTNTNKPKAKRKKKAEPCGAQFNPSPWEVEHTSELKASLELSSRTTRSVTQRNSLKKQQQKPGCGGACL